MIRSLVRSVTKNDVFIFCKNMLTVSDSRTILKDIRKYITYSELKHIVFNLLKQAEEIGLANSTNYKKLKRTYYFIANICARNKNKKIDKRSMDSFETLLENLFEEMCRTVV